MLTSSFRRTLIVALLTGSLLVLPGAAPATAGGRSATVDASSSAKQKKRGKCSKLHSKKARKKCVAKRRAAQREYDEGITAPMPDPVPPVPVPVPVPTDPGAVLPS